jgi:uncharacterized protein with HEPN domain
MTRPEVLKYLIDIQVAGELIARFTAGREFDDYANDPLLSSAVERQFEIIGEALAQALRLEPNLASRITDFRRIIAFRNRLAHGYATVSSRLVWGVVDRYLPELRRQIDELLSHA